MARERGAETVARNFGTDRERQNRVFDFAGKKVRRGNRERRLAANLSRAGNRKRAADRGGATGNSAPPRREIFAARDDFGREISEISGAKNSGNFVAKKIANFERRAFTFNFSDRRKFSISEKSGRDAAGGIRENLAEKSDETSRNFGET